MITQDEKELQWAYQPRKGRIGFIEPHKDKDFFYFTVTSGKKFRVHKDDLTIIDWIEARDNIIPVEDLSTSDLYQILEDHGQIRKEAEITYQAKKKPKKKKAKTKPKQKRLTPEQALAGLDKETLALLRGS